MECVFKLESLSDCVVIYTTLTVPYLCDPFLFRKETETKRAVCIRYHTLCIFTRTIQLCYGAAVHTVPIQWLGLSEILYRSMFHCLIFQGISRHSVCHTFHLS